MMLIGGFGMFPDPKFFWGAFTMVAVGMTLVAIDAIRQPFSRLQKTVILAVLGLVLMAVLRFMVLVPAELSIMIHYSPDPHASGDESLGIRWRPEFGQLEVTISNHSPRDFTDLDIVLTPNRI